ncbi:unnamed protein product [Protopolystoma xenopodis]|uniref:Uncharacterized protein n=1 Tax=Protopolystoma xenopodis TaxID=117903 RepID=A0A3S5AII2_9PLAT|nr:unnamed protein product [Protopolystoma xenopodis]
MSSSSDDAQHMMGESSARSHPKRGRTPLGFCQSERRSKAKRLQYNGIQPPSSGDIELRIYSLCTFIRNECLTTIYSFARYYIVG